MKDLKLKESGNLGLSRRHFLRGLGASLALPSLELWGAPAAAGRLATTPTGAPLRMAFVYFPNGAIQDRWWPKGEGSQFEFASTLSPLEPLRHRVQILGGLDHLNATAGPDGAGDHARANGTFLTGVRVRKTAGADIHAGVSVDQVAAERVGHLTRFPSLELSCDAVRKSGACDSGYSCAYEYNLAWKSPSTPVAPEPNPRLLFERLFGAGAPGERARNLALRRQQKRSILDFVMEDARQLERKLTLRDRDKLDEYLTSVRDIEQRIARAEAFGDPPDPGVASPAGIPPQHQEHIRLMFEMLALAFETDSTRIATLLLAHDGSNRSFHEIGIPEGHHHLSHHRNDAEMMEKVARIDAFYAAEFARFLQRLEERRDADGQTVLHNSMIVYGCGNSDGNRHTHENLPVVLAGNGGGALGGGRFVHAGAQPMCNLFLTMLEQMGVGGLDRFGDSTRPLGLVTA